MCHCAASSLTCRLFVEPSRTPSRKLHVSAHSLTKSSENENYKQKQPSAPSPASSVASVSNSVKFDNMKVYANIGRNSMIESIDLESKDLKAAKSSKSRSNMRRHTHYYCYIPSSVAQAAQNAGALSHEDLSREYSGPSTSSGGRRMSAHTLRRFMAKKMSDTWHSAVRVKKILSDSLTIFK